MYVRNCTFHASSLSFQACMHHGNDALVMDWLRRRLGRNDLLPCFLYYAAFWYLLHYYMTPPCIHLDPKQVIPPSSRSSPDLLARNSQKWVFLFPFPFPLGLGWMGCNLSFSFILGFEISSILWIVLFKHVSNGLLRGEEERIWRIISSILDFGWNWQCIPKRLLLIKDLWRPFPS